MKTTCEIFKEIKSIAVVGISDKIDRDSGRIASFLKEKGFDVVGVHPTLNEVFNIKVYKSLKDIPLKIDLVNVFLSSDKIPFIVNDIKEIKPKYLWLQLGIRNDEAVKQLIKDGIYVIQNACIAVVYRNCNFANKKFK